jgi:hypothetical protein
LETLGDAAPQETDRSDAEPPPLRPDGPDHGLTGEQKKFVELIGKDETGREGQAEEAMSGRPQFDIGGALVGNDSYKRYGATICRSDNLLP